MIARSDNRTDKAKANMFYMMDQVTPAYYDAGHMMYSHGPFRKKLREDLLNFLSSAPETDKKP